MVLAIIAASYCCCCTPWGKQDRSVINAFQNLKEWLISAPILGYPDFTKPFILDTDASKDAIDVVLSQ